MSAKFASITSSLLARKGEALPWSNSGGNSGGNNPASMAEPEKLTLPWRQHVPDVSAAPPPPPPPVKEKSCSVRMSAHDFERLGILAVKKDTTRQQLLKEALAEFLAAKAQDYGCPCLGACNQDCSSEA